MRKLTPLLFLIIVLPLYAANTITYQGQLQDGSGPAAVFLSPFSGVRVL